jgi:hypothetical protein
MGCGASRTSALGVVPSPAPPASIPPSSPLSSAPVVQPITQADQPIETPLITSQHTQSSSQPPSSQPSSVQTVDQSVKVSPLDSKSPVSPSSPADVRLSPPKTSGNNHSPAPSPAPVIPSSSSTDVFLGGSCHPTTWRHDTAIPLLSRRGVHYYNPQVDNWTEELIAIESKAKDEAAILFFVIDSETRALASIVECTEYLCSGREVVLVVKRIKDGSVIGGDKVGPAEMKDLNRARAYIEELAKRHGTAVYSTVEAACEEIIKRIGSRRKLAENTSEKEKNKEDASEKGKSSNESGKVIGEPSTECREDSNEPTSRPSASSDSGGFDAALHAKADRKTAALKTAMGESYINVNDLDIESEDPLNSPSSKSRPTQGVSLPMVDLDAAKLRMQMEMAN